MAKTYQQLQSEIDLLKKQAEEIRGKEIAEVISKIKGAIATYGITAKDLGFSVPTAGGKNGAARIIKFKDKTTGQTWSGRGRRPQWFNAALQAGQSEGDLLA